ncbi:hypothetical protein NNJEOMEG_01873 [Fundidesulfovibrio magnetotacticus]|uniref:Uncharacterized protein n=1 Tax=Fundidesulfovibrio magnetotacticus TaxID=2730080 RepID=A0A6V8M0N7_9BACT|nr:hypothetical protein [Fundidesulfovibrio magnetotacticus]GFK94035.1 hypothetical protein NNJEOMEG_01873 [Fundidesulfovibrio magnetotacticus]
MDVRAWIVERRRTALARARLAGWALLAILLVCGAWLGWREARLPRALDAELARERTAALRTRLKMLTHAAYTAKVAQNGLLADVIGTRDVLTPCIEAGDLRGLPPDAPCRALWEASLEKVWEAAYGPHAPLIPEKLRRDPWGSPYLLNTGEILCGMVGDWCPHDDIGSPGPDGVASTPDDVIVSAPMHLGPERVEAAKAAKAREEADKAASSGSGER